MLSYIEIKPRQFPFIFKLVFLVDWLGWFCHWEKWVGTQLPEQAVATLLHHFFTAMHSVQLWFESPYISGSCNVWGQCFLNLVHTCWKESKAFKSSLKLLPAWSIGTAVEEGILLVGGLPAWCKYFGDLRAPQ